MQKIRLTKQNDETSRFKIKACHTSEGKLRLAKQENMTGHAENKADHAKR